MNGFKDIQSLSKLQTMTMEASSAVMIGAYKFGAQKMEVLYLSKTTPMSRLCTHVTSEVVVIRGTSQEAQAKGHNQQPRRLQVHNLRVGCTWSI